MKLSGGLPRKLSGDIRKPSGDSLEQLLEVNLMNSYVFFLSKVSDRLLSPQNGEGDMHEVPRLRTKIVRGFRERVQAQAKARISNTARTPIAKAIWRTF